MCRKGRCVADKKCSHCSIVKPLAQFSPVKCRGGKPNAWCKDCTATSARNWYHANKERSIARNLEWRESNWDKVLEANRRYATKKRQEVVALLGSKCRCCDERRFSFMSIDHINGGGNKHRKRVPSPATFYNEVMQAIRAGSKEYQLLCMNCNHSKRRLGVCEHELEGQWAKNTPA